MEQIIRSTSSIDANLAKTLIREANAAAFRNRAIGLAAAIGLTSLALSIGVAAMLWANNQRLDPEMLKAALSSMPALKVEGAVKGEVKLADGAIVKLHDGATVKLAEGSGVTVTGVIPSLSQPPIVLPNFKPDEDPSIKTTVTVFKSVDHGEGEVYTGWRFASGSAKSPSHQYCYYLKKVGKGNANQQSVGTNGAIADTAGVAPAEQAARFLKCQWWQAGTL